MTPATEERLAQVWETLGSADAESVGRALALLESVPPEALRGARYGVEGAADLLDVIRIGSTAIRLQQALTRSFLGGFRDEVKGRTRAEALQAYERLDALLAGVMDSAAQHWTVRRPGGQPPFAYDLVVILRRGLARVMRDELKLAEGDDPFARLLDRRIARFDEILRDFAPAALISVP